MGICNSTNDNNNNEKSKNNNALKNEKKVKFDTAGTTNNDLSTKIASNNMEHNNNINYNVNNNNDNNKKTDLEGLYTKQKSIFKFNRLSSITKFDDINKYYTISDTFLGKGAEGIIREGVNEKGEKYAIKTIWKSDITKNECFQREIEITLAVDHENVIKCKEIYEDLSSVNLVLDLIQGGDLFDHIIHSDKRKLKPDEAIEILYQILKAIQYLHVELKVSHRDIKPENFLIVNENNKNKIILIDFGFATFIPENGLMTDQLGTPQYCAPEILMGQPYTSKVDLWAIGIVLFNMINGCQPFRNDKNDPYCLVNEILQKKINFDGFNENKNLKKICMGLLERDPNLRFDSYKALSELQMIRNTSYNEDNCNCATVQDKFRPDIKHIMIIINNDKSIVIELRNILLEFLNIPQMKNLYKELIFFHQAETGDQLLVGKIYLNAIKIVDYTLNCNDFDPTLKKSLEDFKISKGNDKLDKQMINIKTFFNTLIEGKKFIQKQIVLNDFKKFDTECKGFLEKNEIDAIFTDKAKRNKLPIIRKGERIDFEKFYHLWMDYEEISY